MFGKGIENAGSDQAEIARVEVDVFIDSVQYRSFDGDVYGSEFLGDFTSIAGTSSFSDSVYSTTFNNPPVLGQLIRGDMKVTFLDNPRRVNVHVFQTKAWDNITGNHGQGFRVDISGVPYNKSYTDDFTELEVDEYYESGSSVNRIVVNFEENWKVNNGDKTETLISHNCGNRANIKVKIHYK